MFCPNYVGLIAQVGILRLEQGALNGPISLLVTVDHCREKVDTKTSPKLFLSPTLTLLMVSRPIIYRHFSFELLYLNTAESRDVLEYTF